MPPQFHTDTTPVLPMIGYIRVSMKREEMISPAIQKDAITVWARRNHREIVHWIEDLDQTGRNFKRKVQRAIEQVDGKTIRGISVFRYDRWGRNAAESLANVKRVEMVGGIVESATEPLDPETAIGRYNRTNAFALAEMQSDIIGDNWKAAHDHRKALGLPAAGGLRFGYLRLGRIPDPIESYKTLRHPGEVERYVPDWDTWSPIALADAYCLYVASHSMGELVRRLKHEGIMNAHGRPWSAQALTNVLDSGFGAGLLREHDPDCRCGKPSNCKRSIYLPGAQEPVIDMDVWEAYRRRRGIAAVTHPKILKGQYTLTGLVVCGQCHGRMVISGQKGRPGYLFRCARWRDYGDCPGSWPLRKTLEAAVLEALRGWADDVESHGAVTTARRRARVVAEEAAGTARRRIDKADKALSRLLLQRVREPDMPEEVYELARGELLAERSSAEHDLKLTVAETDRTVAVDHGPVIAGLLSEWVLMPPVRRRDVLAQLIRHVKVYRDEEGAPLRIGITPVWEPCAEPCCATAQASDLATVG